MEVIRNFYQPWLEKWSNEWRNHRFQAILLICFSIWTPVLVAETLQVQNSCHPMIHWSRELSPECDKIDGGKIIRNGGDGGNKKGGNKIIEISKQIIDSAKQHPDLTGASIGIAFATGAALASTPLVVTVGIGIALWLAIRTALSS